MLAVDDGSTDDTWLHITDAWRERPNIVQPIRLPANQGKRAALAAGSCSAYCTPTFTS
ncbi:MAG: glycosyltransferase [Nitrospirota bacterium]|nr:glycosyltransferase [Nitrospirota bacterium]